MQDFSARSWQFVRENKMHVVSQRRREKTRARTTSTWQQDSTLLKEVAIILRERTSTAFALCGRAQQELPEETAFSADFSWSGKLRR